MFLLHKFTFNYSCLMTNRRTPFLIVLLIAIIGISSCSESVLDDLPNPISKFIAQYYPGESVSSYSEGDGDLYRVKIKNGATIVFDYNFDWSSIEGNGTTVPVQLMFDQFPARLYDYIESIGALHSVYGVSRNAENYTVYLTDSTLSYDINTKTVSYVDKVA